MERTCPACGYPASDELTTCWACGTALPSAETKRPVIPAGPGKGTFHFESGVDEGPPVPEAAEAIANDEEEVPALDESQFEEIQRKPSAIDDRPASPAHSVASFDQPALTTGPVAPTRPAPRTLALVGIPLVLIVAVILFFVFTSHKRAILARVTDGRLVTPVGDSAYDRYLEYERKRPSSSAIAQITAAAMPPLEARGEEILRRLKEENLESEAEWGEAVRLFDWLNRLRPSSGYLARYHFSQGRLRFTKGENTTAMNDYQQAMAAEPSWALPLNGMARVFVRMQDRTAAQQYYRRATEVEPGWIYPWVNLGVVSYELKDHATAEWALRRALSLDVTKASAYYYLARVLDDAGRPCDAVASYRSAVDNAYRSNSPGFSIDAARNRIARLVNRYACR